MPETHELPLDVIRKAWDEHVKAGAEGDSTGSPWAGVDYEGNEERAVKFARAIVTAARESDAPELPWATVLKVTQSVIENESTDAEHWKRVGFPDHVIRAAVEAGAKAQRALGVSRESDAAARIAAKREGWDAAQAFICGPAIAGAVLDAERDRLYPLPARECVLSEAEPPVLTWHDAGWHKRDLADETGLVVGHINDCNAYLGQEHLGRYINYERAQDAVMGAALKSFAAGVGR